MAGIGTIDESQRKVASVVGFTLLCTLVRDSLVATAIGRMVFSAGGRRQVRKE